MTNKAIEIALTGTITGTSSCGRYGEVTLDEPYEGYRKGLIDDKTVGRGKLLRRTERIEVDTPVLIQKVKLGVQALHVIRLEPR